MRPPAQLLFAAPDPQTGKGERPPGTAEVLFELYRKLSDDCARGRGLPAPLGAALERIRSAAEANEDGCTLEGATKIEAKLARVLAQTVTFERASELAVRMLGEMGSHRPSREEIYRATLLFHFESPRCALHASELTEDWAAMTYVRVLLNHCTPRWLKEIAEREGGDIYLNPGPDFARAFHEQYVKFARPFQVRSGALREDMACSPRGSARSDALEASHVQAEQDRFYGPGAMLAFDADLAAAAAECGPEAEEVYRLLTSGNPLEILSEKPRPHEAHRYAVELAREGQGVLNLAAERRQRLLGALPVMRSTEEALREANLLSAASLHRLELGMRDHLTPVVEQLLRRLGELGLRHCHVAGKGVSTIPLVAAAMGHRAKTLDTGIGDSRLDAEALVARTRGQILDWAEAAASKDAPLLILGDGYETARAANEAARIAKARAPGLRVGYVAVTQSDLNYLGQEARKPGGLHMDVTALAGTVLKDAVTSQDIADWIVRHEGSWLEAEKRRPLADSSVAIIGGGNIGAALAHALIERGHQKLTIVDREPEAVRDRLRQLGHDPADVDVRARRGARLPPADYYFSAVGRPRVIRRSTLKAMPDGAVVFNCASRGEIDEAFLTRRAGSVSAQSELANRERELLPEHRTQEVSFYARGRRRRTVLVRRMGQPAFDGIDEKDVKAIDITFSGALAATAEALARLERGFGGEQCSLQSLSSEWQAQIISAAEESYALDLSTARAALAARDQKTARE